MKKLLFLLFFPLLTIGQTVPADSTVRALINSKIPNRGTRATGYSAADVRTTLDGVVDYVNKKTPFVTPEMYGAKGDGVTDDTQAWKKCVASFSVSGMGRKIFAPGKYLISSTITHQNTQTYGVGLRIEGAGTQQSGFYTQNLNGPLFRLLGNDDQTANNTTFKQAYGAEFSNLFVRKAPTSTTGASTALELNCQRKFSVTNLFLYGLDGDGIRISANGFGDYGESADGLIERVTCIGIAGTAFKMKENTSQAVVASYIRIQSSTAVYCGTGIYIEGGNHIYILNSQITANYVRGIHIGVGSGTARHITIEGNELGNVNTESSIRVDGCDGLVIRDNNFVNNSPGELTEKQVILGKADGTGYINNVLIEHNTIIQSRAGFTSTQHYQYFLNPGVQNVTIRNDIWAVFASGTKYNDLSRINVLEERDRDTGNLIAKRTGKVPYVSNTNPTSYTPEPNKANRFYYDAATTTTITSPTGNFQDLTEMVIGVWNNSNAVITWNLSGAFKGTTLTIPAGEKDTAIKFIWIYDAWYIQR